MVIGDGIKQYNGMDNGDCNTKPDDENYFEQSCLEKFQAPMDLRQIWYSLKGTTTMSRHVKTKYVQEEIANICEKIFTPW